MQLSVDTHIPYPRAAVFALYRDDMKSLLPYLPNVVSIEVTSRKDDGPVAQLVNEWRGGGDIPSAVRAVLGEKALAWTDYATWDETAAHCDWRTETHVFKDALRCSGRNRFIEKGPRDTVLEIRGTLEVDATKIRGVPSFLAGRAARAIEDFLTTRIQANLTETAKAVAKYLEDHPRTSS
ncbi:MAG TPA: hypothetical protein VKU41_14295 [Polyangiaceae bacterium]|nr:hypothetical protein [Polyangiaceae bacterium]